MTLIKRTIENPMYYGASDLIIKRAKELRKRQTAAEIRMWKILGAKKMCGLHFRRQHPIYRYIADFYCHSIKLVIEVDGNIHEIPDNNESDMNRTAELDMFEIVVIRYKNEEVINSLEEVRKSIERTCLELFEKYRAEEL